MPKLPYVVVAILLGGMIALQPGLNAEVARRIGSPFGAAFISILVAFVMSLAYVLIVRPVVAWGSLAGMPWYLWVAGSLGYIFVVGGLWLAPILGATLLFGSFVAGQMLMALVADRFGIAGYQGHAIDGWRIAGVALVVVGVWMFQRAA